MAACEVYLRVMTWPLSALAVYDAGAALRRSIGKTRVTMYISAAANVVNIIGNCVGVFVLKMGTAGVAYPSLISRAQCMGAGNIDSANFYFKKINKLTLFLSIAWNALIFAITPLLLRFFLISDETKSLVLINNIFNGLAYPFAGPLGSGLRAAGDVRFTMVIFFTLTIGMRLFFSAPLGLWLGWGVIGVAVGMSLDLVFRGIIFLRRYKSQKWTRFQQV